MRLFLFLFFLSSCSDQVNWRFDGAFEPQEEEVSAFPFFSFETRLTPQLAISGRVCDGGEVVVSEGITFACERDQWLIVVDNTNFCTPDGCTEIEVEPFIGGLLSRSDGEFPELFDIQPGIPVSDESETILESVLIRFSPGEGPVVVFE